MVSKNNLYTSAKSGSTVRTIEKQKNTYRGSVLWEVERIDNGKRMIMSEKSLLPFIGEVDKYITVENN
jgi:hypothetical protein